MERGVGVASGDGKFENGAKAHREVGMSHTLESQLQTFEDDVQRVHRLVGQFEFDEGDEESIIAAISNAKNLIDQELIVYRWYPIFHNNIEALKAHVEKDLRSGVAKLLGGETLPFT